MIGKWPEEIGEYVILGCSCIASNSQNQVILAVLN